MPAKDGNTSNLMAHLREHYPDLYTEAIALQDQQCASGSCGRRGSKCDCSNRSSNSTIGGPTTSQMTVTELFEASRKFSPTSSQAVELNKSVAYYLASPSTL